MNTVELFTITLTFAVDFSNVPGECPVMCGTCKADGSAGDNFVPAPETKLIAGNGKENVH